MSQASIRDGCYCCCKDRVSLYRASITCDLSFRDRDPKLTHMHKLATLTTWEQTVWTSLVTLTCVLRSVRLRLKVLLSDTSICCRAGHMPQSIEHKFVHTHTHNTNHTTNRVIILCVCVGQVVWAPVARWGLLSHGGVSTGLHALGTHTLECSYLTVCGRPHYR